MRASEFLREETDPREQPTRQAFEQSVQSMVKFIRASIADFNAELDNYKTRNVNDYNKRISDKNALAAEFQNHIANTIKERGVGYLGSNEISNILSSANLKFPSSVKPTAQPTTQPTAQPTAKPDWKQQRAQQFAKAKAKSNTPTTTTTSIGSVPKSPTPTTLGSALGNVAKANVARKEPVKKLEPKYDYDAEYAFREKGK